jgi:hypothetical protein
MTRRALSALSTDTWEMSLDLSALAVLRPPRKPRRPVAEISLGRTLAEIPYGLPPWRREAHFSSASLRHSSHPFPAFEQRPRSSEVSSHRGAGVGLGLGEKGGGQ